MRSDYAEVYLSNGEKVKVMLTQKQEGVWEVQVSRNNRDASYEQAGTLHKVGKLWYPAFYLSGLMNKGYSDRGAALDFLVHDFYRSSPLSQNPLWSGIQVGPHLSEFGL